jgi:flap endonuclease-1
MSETVYKLYSVMMQAGNQEDIAKYSKRTVRVTQQHNDECKRLLTLMGVPIINVSVAML